MAKYQGHRSWNAWNVSLWINNDEGLYQMARNIAREYKGNRRAGAQAMCYRLECDGITHTPDGAPYSATTIREAMRDM